MNILLLGSGGREHAFAWKLKQSPLCSKLFIAPGNAGTLEFGENLDISVNDFLQIKDLCIREKIELVLVGPEEPLVLGIVDYFRMDSQLSHINIIGPSMEAARLEGSKSYAKAFMTKYNIPTAGCREFSLYSYTEGIEYLKNHTLPVVIKADGLAAGKGVLICQSHIEALSEFELMLHQEKFGAAGRKVVVEDFLEGIEMSVFVLTDGKNYVLLPEAKDYKRIGVGDTGLNTGGMGAISPVPFADEAFMEKVIKRVVEPTIKGLEEEKLDYKGFVFIGLMKVGDDPIVIEYNCRMGDPETEAVIPRLKNDLVKLFIATHEGKLADVKIETDQRATVAIVAVSGGYPGEFHKGLPIDFGELNNPEIKKVLTKDDSVLVFHGGTKRSEREVLTNGGRVLAVSAFGKDIPDAVETAIGVLDQISFEGMYYRNDIGYEFMANGM